MHILGLVAETFIHPGSGQAMGAIDLPVARERASGLPYISGSSMKGAFKQAMRGLIDCNDLCKAFGAPGADVGAGGIVFSDARLLFLPVRSLTTGYAWLTCPMLLDRLARDVRRARAGAGGADIDVSSLEPTPGEMLVKGFGAFAVGEPHYLEDRALEASAISDDGATAIDRLFVAANLSDRGDTLTKRLAIVSDEDFLWFCSYGLHVQARNSLTENKISKTLWYEELLPPDTAFYMLLDDRGSARLAGDMLGRLQYLQVGGNETLGQGWFRLYPGKELSRDGGE